MVHFSINNVDIEYLTAADIFIDRRNYSERGILFLSWRPRNCARL